MSLPSVKVSRRLSGPAKASLSTSPNALISVSAKITVLLPVVTGKGVPRPLSRTSASVIGKVRTRVGTASRAARTCWRRTVACVFVSATASMAAHLTMLEEQQPGDVGAGKDTISVDVNGSRTSIKQERLIETKSECRYGLQRHEIEERAHNAVAKHGCSG